MPARSGSASGRRTSTSSRELSLGRRAPLRHGVRRRVPRWTSSRSRRASSASWMDGGQPILDGPNAGSSTTRPAPGAQVFPGFPPRRRAGRDAEQLCPVRRTSKTDSRRSCSLGARGPVRGLQRFRHRRRTGKVTARYAILPQLALRGAVQHRIPCAIARAVVLLVDGDELLRRRPVPRDPDASR